MQSNQDQHYMAKGLPFVQINLQHCRAASYNLAVEVQGLQSFVILAQEPWVHPHKIMGLPIQWNLYWDQSAELPRACIATPPSVHGLKLSQFDTRDSVAILMKGKGRHTDFVLASIYMAHGDALPPPVLVELNEFCRTRGLGLLVGCDANARHTIWGSTVINERGEELFDYLAASHLYWCNVGNKPTFMTANRREVLDLTLANQAMVDRVRGWHVSDNPSLSDHAYLRFSLSHDNCRGRWVKPISRADWSLYNQTLPALLPSANAVLTSQEDVDRVADGMIDAIHTAFDTACPPKWVSNKCKNSPFWSPKAF